jgi:sugar/nucleoside kinase (ribokinase family)
MSDIFIAGLINLETTLQVDDFPIYYTPVQYPFFGVNSSISGVGYNIAKALTCLGDQVVLASLIGQDAVSRLVRETLFADHIPDQWVLETIHDTAQSNIIYDKTGRRMINVDLKDIQERVYPVDVALPELKKCEVAVLCNINFSRPLLIEAQKLGKQIATDVHTVGDLDDAYNLDYMAAANILFMSDEKLPCSPEEWARRLFCRFGCEILVIGLGKQGALMAVRKDGFIERFPTVKTRPVVNTIGAGDALFSSFIHFYFKTSDEVNSLQKALVFASYKIGSISASDGFLSEDELLSLMERKVDSKS